MPTIPVRLIAPIVVVIVAVAVWASGLTDHLSWAAIARDHAILEAWVVAHPVTAPCLYVVFYAASVTLSLPYAALLTMLGGLLFGVVAGAALAVTGATTGALLIFLIARSAFAGPLERRGGSTLRKLRDELRRNGFSYLLALRLAPVVPFWLVNLAAALGGIRLRHFFAATAIGIIPMTSVVASIGAGLGQVLARGEQPDFGVILSLPVLGPLLALAVVSLIPVVWRKWRARNA